VRDIKLLYLVKPYPLFDCWRVDFVSKKKINTIYRKKHL